MIVTKVLYMSLCAPALMALEFAALAATGTPQPRKVSGSQPLTNSHWAFIAPKRTAVPQVRHGNWVRNPIDAFILARLEKERMQPSPAADRATLIRRLCLDLVGLPPS